MLLNIHRSKRSMPEVYQRPERDRSRNLEHYFKDMQDIEFTIQDGKLWMLQTRNGKRTGAAMVKIAMDMLRAGSDRRKDRTCCACEPAETRRTAPPGFRQDAVANAPASSPRACPPHRAPPRVQSCSSPTTPKNGAGETGKKVGHGTHRDFARRPARACS